MGELSERTATAIAKYSKVKVITPTEMANAVLKILTSTDAPDGDIISAVESLPPQVRQALLDLLPHVRDAGFRWKLARVGARPDAPGLDPKRLRHVYELLIPGSSAPGT